MSSDAVVVDPEERPDHDEAPGSEAGGHLSRRALLGLGVIGATTAAALAAEVLGAQSAAAAAPATAESLAAVAHAAATTPVDGDTGAALQFLAGFAYAGDGPNGATYDRLRLLTAKLPHHLQIASGGGVGSTSVTLTSPPIGLNPGEPILFTGGNPEFLYTAGSYVAETNPVLLASPIQFAGHNMVTYDTRAATGPRATDMTPFGMLPVGCVISEGPNGLYTMMLGAGVDQGPPINTVMVSPSLVSGPAAQMDRQRSLSNAGDGLGVALASQPSSHPASVISTPNGAASIVFPATGGQTHRLTMLAASYSSTPTGGGLAVLDGTTTILSIDMESASPLLLPLPPGGIMGTIGRAMTITLMAGGANCVAKLNVAKLTA
ncbi:MAG: hypothetical protein M3256_18825 [Actinomycetota bacterium]|nr:hypothetical protein [Actinomycetota bacterium]